MNATLEIIRKYLATELELSDEEYISNLDLLENELFAPDGKLTQPISVGDLLSVLDDKSEFDGPSFQIIHLAERFETDEYISGLIESSDSFIPSCPKWASIVFMRVLNDDESRAVLVSKLRGSPRSSRARIVQLMEAIENESYEFLDRTIPVKFAAREKGDLN
ncbi:MAG: Imm30 family immunity protein [Pseudomonadota bacterium]